MIPRHAEERERESGKSIRARLLHLLWLGKKRRRFSTCQTRRRSCHKDKAIKWKTQTKRREEEEEKIFGQVVKDYFCSGKEKENSSVTGVRELLQERERTPWWSHHFPPIFSPLPLSFLFFSFFLSVSLGREPVQTTTSLLIIWAGKALSYNEVSKTIPTSFVPPLPYYDQYFRQPVKNLIMPIHTLPGDDINISLLTM